MRTNWRGQSWLILSWLYLGASAAIEGRECLFTYLRWYSPTYAPNHQPKSSFASSTAITKALPFSSISTSTLHNPTPRPSPHPRPLFASITQPFFFSKPFGFHVKAFVIGVLIFWWTILNADFWPWDVSNFIPISDSGRQDSMKIQEDLSFSRILLSLHVCTPVDAAHASNSIADYHSHWNRSHKIAFEAHLFLATLSWMDPCVQRRRMVGLIPTAFELPIKFLAFLIFLREEIWNAPIFTLLLPHRGQPDLLLLDVRKAWFHLQNQF